MMFIKKVENFKELAVSSWIIDEGLIRRSTHFATAIPYEDQADSAVSAVCVPILLASTSSRICD